MTEYVFGVPSTVQPDYTILERLKKFTSSKKEQNQQESDQSSTMKIDPEFLWEMFDINTKIIDDISRFVYDKEMVRRKSEVMKRLTLFGRCILSVLWLQRAECGLKVTPRK